MTKDEAVNDLKELQEFAAEYLKLDYSESLDYAIEVIENNVLERETQYGIDQSEATRKNNLYSNSFWGALLFIFAAIAYSTSAIISGMLLYAALIRFIKILGYRYPHIVNDTDGLQLIVYNNTK